MQYSIVINQVGIVKAGLHKKTDFTDWAIIDYIIHWFFSKDAKKGRDEEEEYVWINYNHLLEQMPMLPAKDKPGLSERFKKLRQLGLIKSYQVKKSGSMYKNQKLRKKKWLKKRGCLLKHNRGGCCHQTNRVFMESQQGCSWKANTYTLISLIRISRLKKKKKKTHLLLQTL